MWLHESYKKPLRNRLYGNEKKSTFLIRYKKRPGISGLGYLNEVLKAQLS